MLGTAWRRESYLEEEGEGNDGGLKAMLTHGLVADVCTMAVPTVQECLDQDIVQVARAAICSGSSTVRLCSTSAGISPVLW